MLQNAEGLLCPKNARFHKVGSISDYFIKRLLAAFFLNATSYRCHALPECSCSASTMMRMYSNRSGPLEGSAAVNTLAYAEKAMNQSRMDVICLRVWGCLDNASCCEFSLPNWICIGCGLFRAWLPGSTVESSTN